MKLSITGFVSNFHKKMIDIVDIMTTVLANPDILLAEAALSRANEVGVLCFP